ncbi:hypothetical protein QP905_08260 [Corynebacterium pseudodiphtheriticum]|uniref:hypothetical protein n=1 Tax=Corynebacterium pseudodiphtheriticum TaxID=37637 RepID=UPI00254F9D23|nr:hypothetical protein [Corynebacterium pseudodiphtheriticum]MDK8578338.1 hypothetical protein [Corynebacterium pseudodiphtheriticum]
MPNANETHNTTDDNQNNTQAVTPDNDGETQDDAQDTGRASTEQDNADDAKAEAGSIDELPEWAQKEIRGLRDENGGRRNRAKDAEKRAEEAEQQATEYRSKFDKLMEFLQGDGDGKNDPEEVIKSLQEKNASTQAELDNLRRDRALHDAITKHGADAKLTAGFIKGEGLLKELDPSDDDYAKNVESIVKQVVEDQPRLLSKQAPASSGHSGTRSGDAKQITRDDLENMSAKDIHKAMRDGKLKHLY